MNNSPYEDDYQTQEQIDLEEEIENEKERIIDDPSLSFLAVLEYLKSEDFSKDEDQTENLENIIRMVINASRFFRNNSDVSLVNAAINWQATKNIGEL